MTGLLRTPLPTSLKSELAASALAGQGQYGVVTKLAERFEISRPTVYAARREARATLDSHYRRAEHGLRALVPVDDAQLSRMIVALRVVGQNSIRAIENLLPVLYPGVSRSYGTIQAILAEAEKRAADFNRQASLSSIRAVALDEMFSQSKPVLAGVCLDSGYLFGLSLEEQRTAKEWAAFLERAKDQSLDVEVVVKDAARGIGKGVRDVFPRAEQRDDCFHALYRMGKVRHRLEAKAYGAMARVLEAEAACERVRRSGRGSRRNMTMRLQAARRRCAHAIALHDAFELAMNDAVEALAFVDLDTAHVRSPREMERLLLDAAQRMFAVDDYECRRVGKYIHNRAPGLARHMKALVAHLSALEERFGVDAVRVAAVTWRLVDDLRHGRRRWAKYEMRRLLAGAMSILGGLAGEQLEELLAAVDLVIQRRHRASSAIEGFNAALRPFLYIHKGVTQGFLELFRAYHNLKTRRWGRHKNTSAHECITGQPVTDWLALLGYAPSESLH